ncbi:MAG: dockerin type I domain-containing protein [Betaproteobacteria bacterium]
MADLKSTSVFLAVACLFSNGLASAGGQGSANFAIPFDAFNNGLGEMSSTNHRLVASIGDAVAAGTISSVSFQLRNGFRGQLSANQAVLNLLTVVSRKMHGATPFTLTIDHTQLISGAVTVEPRAIGSGHTLVFHFDGNVNQVTAASALDAMMNSAGTATPVKSGNDVIVTLANVPDMQRLTITLTGLNGSGTASASVGFLVGDVGNTRAVTAADISAVKANQGKPVNNNALALFDLNADGTINANDLSAVRVRSGWVLPP